MRNGSNSTSGRHRGQPEETPATSRRGSGRHAHRGGNASDGPSSASRGAKPVAAPSRTATPQARRHPKIAAASLASAGLVASLCFALPANAVTPGGAPMASSFGAYPGQSLTVSEGAHSPGVERSSYGAVDTSGGIVGASVAPGGLTNVDWATLVLEDGGWPTNANNVTVILQWMDSENGPQSWWNRNNPLNNGYGSGGGAGFGSYSNLLVAAEDVVANLEHGSAYADIVSNLASSAPTATTAAAIWASPWAGSHYGYGSLWHAVEIPIVTAPASAW